MTTCPVCLKCAAIYADETRPSGLNPASWEVGDMARNPRPRCEESAELHVNSVPGNNISGKVKGNLGQQNIPAVGGRTSTDDYCD